MGIIYISGGNKLVQFKNSEHQLAYNHNELKQQELNDVLYKMVQNCLNESAMSERLVTLNHKHNVNLKDLQDGLINFFVKYLMTQFEQPKPEILARFIDDCCEKLVELSHHTDLLDNFVEGLNFFSQVMFYEQYVAQEKKFFPIKKKAQSSLDLFNELMVFPEEEHSCIIPKEIFDNMLSFLFKDAPQFNFMEDRARIMDLHELCEINNVDSSNLFHLLDFSLALYGESMLLEDS